MPLPDELAIEGALLRPYRSGDELALRRAADDADVAANMRLQFPHPYSDQDARTWVELASTSLRGLQRAIVVDEAVAGGIGFIPYDDVHAGTFEIGYWLGRAHWGRGLATAAVVAMTRAGFAELGAARIHATVFEWNPASVRVLEKAGYRHEGRLRAHVRKNGRLGDAIMMARLATDP